MPGAGERSVYPFLYLFLGSLHAVMLALVASRPLPAGRGLWMARPSALLLWMSEHAGYLGRAAL